MGPKRPIGGAILLASAGVVAINLLLKLRGIGGDSLWLDEAITAFYAQQPTNNVMAYAGRQQNPFLYFLLTKGWVALFGPTEAALRSFSAILSSLTAGVLFLLASRFLGLFAALVATALFTVSPLQVHYAQEARAYALIGLLCVLSFWLFFHLIEKRSRRSIFLLGLVNAALLYTHYTSVFILCAQALACILPGRHAARARRAYFTSLLLTGILFLPWAPTLLSNVPGAGAGWLEVPRANTLWSAGVNLAGGPWLALLSLVVITGGLAAAGRARATTGHDRSNDYFFYLILWAFVPLFADFAVSQFVPVFLERYLLYTSLGLVLLIGHSAAALRLGRTGRSLLVVALVTAALAGYRSRPIRTEHWRALADAVSAESSAQTTVFVAPVWTCLPFAYYFSPEAFADHLRIRDRLADQGVFCLDPGESHEGPPNASVQRFLVVTDRNRITIEPASLLPPSVRQEYAPVRQQPFGALRLDVYDRLSTRAGDR